MQTHAGRPDPVVTRVLTRPCPAIFRQFFRRFSAQIDGRRSSGPFGTIFTPPCTLFHLLQFFQASMVATSIFSIAACKRHSRDSNLPRLKCRGRPTAAHSRQKPSKIAAVQLSLPTYRVKPRPRQPVSWSFWTKLFVVLDEIVALFWTYKYIS